MRKVNVVLTKDNYQTITEIAKKLFVSKSDVVRLLISHIHRRKITLEELDKNEKKDVIFSFVVSNNFNHLDLLKSQTNIENTTELINRIIKTSRKTFKVSG